MYKSFLSHAQRKEYVSFLERSLVDKVHQQVKNGNEKLAYKITDKESRVFQIALYQIENIDAMTELIKQTNEESKRLRSQDD
jgi:GTPase Era involved in 16S rRNA processing